MRTNTSESAWTIRSWSRQHGRGAIQSEQLGIIEFDGSRADVDDFTVGEPVDVELEREGSHFRVTRIQPTQRRLPGKGMDTAGTAPLNAGVEQVIASELAGKGVSLDYELRDLTDGVLTLVGDDSLFEYGHTDEIEISGIGYVALPHRLGCLAFRLATHVERFTVAQRTEITSSDVVFTFVDAESRFHYVVGDGLRWRRKT